MDVLIVEDYPQVAKRVQRLTREILGERLSSMKHIEQFSQAEEHLSRFPVDVLLLDLNLGGDDGFDLLKRAVAGAFQTIVISAQTERALEAFEYGVLDFVPKPFSSDRLSKAFARLGGGEHSESSGIKYLAVKDTARIKLVNLSEVLYIKGAGNYTELHLKDGATVLHEKKLDDLTLLLSPHFERIHKSYLVRFSEIKEVLVHGGGRYSVTLQNEETLPLGRTRYKHLRDRSNNIVL